MATASIKSAQLIAIEGELKFPVIMQLRKQVESLLSGLNGTAQIDFAAVTAVDSSALSFWLCCLRFAKRNKLELEPINLPVEMQGIAKLVGLEDLTN
ncbi:lipid asymmetry maintenance protein MlaB [Neptuniibacter sp. QD72_48]|uniref:STAS domain-containing protein n=1 Tax=Neptuniibacter sp. QD72_48 TaxID=3398214 RepID=UPI0039F6241A